jgi:predicted transposase YdaD
LAVLPLAPLCRLPAGIPIEDSLRDVVVREINRRLTAEADHAEAVRLMTAAYILTGLRIKKGSLANIYKGIGMLQESAAYDEIMEEGEIRRSHRNLLLLGKERFGPPDEAVKNELLAIRDLERLERLVQAILTAKSWRVLLDTE